MLKMSEVNKLSKEDAASQVANLRKELFELKMEKKTSGLDKSHKLIEVKKDIARLLTRVNTK